jgi:hypothetical protein
MPPNQQIYSNLGGFNRGSGGRWPISEMGGRPSWRPVVEAVLPPMWRQDDKGHAADCRGGLRWPMGPARAVWRCQRYVDEAVILAPASSLCEPPPGE